MSDTDPGDTGPDDDFDGDDEDFNQVDFNTVDEPATAVAVLEYICQQIVSEPNAVEVEVEPRSDDRYELTVTVDPSDTGRVIGRRGRTAQAIRAVVRAAAAKDGVEVGVEFLD